MFDVGGYKAECLSYVERMGCGWFWEPSASVYRAKGRKPSVDVERVRELKESGMGASAIARELGIGRASVYRALGS